MTKHLCVLFLFLLIGGILHSCKKTEYTYQIENENLYPDNAGKVKLKSDEQYVSILYANLFQEALGANELVRVVRCIKANGDKDLIHEVLVSNFMNRPDVQLPTSEIMRANPDSFIVETYKRFLVRFPTEAEKTWFRNYINTHPTVTPEIVYSSFAISNEYQFY
ncbi:MAG: hypothetical protein K1X82_03280 [Bacteroidia bacterium]|nr:hypothetical protein [Bacteroidia bacterium]